MTDTESVAAVPPDADVPRKATKANVAAVVGPATGLLTAWAAGMLGIGGGADAGAVDTATVELTAGLTAWANEAIGLAVGAVVAWFATFRTRNKPVEPKAGAGGRRRAFLPLVGLLVLGACATGAEGGPGLLDRLVSTRCDEAAQTLQRLGDTADLYEADDLAARLARANRLAEIWCPDYEPEPIAPPADGGVGT